MLIAAGLLSIFSMVPALATAALDDDSPSGPLMQTAPLPVIDLNPPKVSPQPVGTGGLTAAGNTVVPDLKDTVLSITLPLENAGNIIPYVPEPPPPAPRSISLPPPYSPSYKPPLAWRLQANELFARPPGNKILSQTFTMTPADAMASLIREGQFLGLKPAMATMSGHLLVELTGMENKTWFVIAIASLPDGRCESRLKILPYPLVTTSTLARQYLFRAANPPRKDLSL
ncbi:MAG: hypothetical protein KC777_15760 [Cyanobacteria bacterium HKST-UBA02]|nr:hypothetical protein [Cyanobacteria bacterium HKST-UBA02]